MSALLLLVALAARPTPAPQATPRPAPRVYTNDDLEGYREPTASPAPAASPEATSPSPSGAPEGDEGRSASASILDQVKRAREALAEAEKARDTVRERVSALELRLNPMSSDFEGDPYAAFALQAELRDARTALQEQEAVVASAREELDLAETRARRAGVRLPPTPER